VAPGLPSSFDAWFMRALEREPDRRFSTVSEMADGLANAAGMAPRSQVASSHGGNVAQMPPAAVHQGASTPQGIGPVMTPGAPFVSGPEQFPGRGATPNPAGMTNAPFTSSQPVQGVGGGRGKLLAGMLVVALAGIGGGVAYRLKVKHDVNAIDGARLTPAVAVSVAVTPAPPAPEHPPDPVMTTTPGAGSIAVNAAPPASAQPPAPKVTNTKTGPTKTPPTAPKPTTTPLPTTTTPPAPTPAPTPVPTTTAKKPPKNPSDPGY
jgi:hypothetical protein